MFTDVPLRSFSLKSYQWKVPATFKLRVTRMHMGEGGVSVFTMYKFKKPF